MSTGDSRLEPAKIQSPGKIPSGVRRSSLTRPRRPSWSLVVKAPLLSGLSAVFGLLLVTVSAFGGDMERLAGKWTSERKNAEGATVKTTIEITGDKFKFRMADGSGEVRLFAEGTVKIEKHGEFQALRFGNIRAGRAESDLAEVSEERLNPFRLSEDTLTLVSGLDREREEPPRIDLYKKAPKTEPKKNG